MLPHLGFTARITPNPQNGGPELVVHHVAAFVSVLRSLQQQQAHVYTLAMLATEATTPLINARWLMDKAGMRAHPAYIANGVGLLVAWVVFRLLLFVPFVQHVVQHWKELEMLTSYDRAIVVVVPILLWSLNLWWFTKILRGALKLVLGDKKQD